MTNIGNKTGGGSEVTATTTSITIDGVTTNLDVGLGQTAVDARVVALTQDSAQKANAGLFKRVDTGAWEVPRPSYAQIQSVADGPGGTKVTVTSSAHGQPEGGTVVIAGTTDYDGTFVISNVTDNTFDIIETFGVTKTGSFTSENIYYSPNHHGGVFGVVGRQYYKGSPTGAVTTLKVGFNTARYFLEANGGIASPATSEVYPANSYNSAASVARIGVEAGDLVIRLGTALDDTDDVFRIWVDSTAR